LICSCRLPLLRPWRPGQLLCWIHTPEQLALHIFIIIFLIILIIFFFFAVDRRYLICLIAHPQKWEKKKKTQGHSYRYVQSCPLHMGTPTIPLPPHPFLRLSGYFEVSPLLNLVSPYSSQQNYICIAYYYLAQIKATLQTEN
jgi:hypothetical protein